MTPPPRILIAGIGNIFLGDDAFGTEVAQRLLHRPTPLDATVIDFGIRGIDLLYSLLEPWTAAIFIDAAPRRQGPPGTLYILEPQLDHQSQAPPMLEGHNMDPVKVLHAAAAMGATLRRITIVACEPSPLNEEDDMPAMTPAVRAAIDPAIALVESLVTQLRAGSPETCASAP